MFKNKKSPEGQYMPDPAKLRRYSIYISKETQPCPGPKP